MPKEPSKTRQEIPVVKPAVFDLEALVHARKRVADYSTDPGTDARIVHPLDSRALSELDRLIDQARTAP